MFFKLVYSQVAIKHSNTGLAYVEYSLQQVSEVYQTKDCSGCGCQMCDHTVLLQQPVPLPFWLLSVMLQLKAAVTPCSKEEYHILSCFYLLGSLSHSFFNQLTIYKKRFKLSSVCCPECYEASNSSPHTLMPNTSETE